MVKYMLFADEAPLTAPVTGVSTFTMTFPQRGPRDKQGRSLRDFDLKTRLFRYPLSYMIYSAAFDALPDMARERVYRRIFEVLTGKDQSKTFARLSAENRRAALEILRETKPNLPAYEHARFGSGADLPVRGRPPGRLGAERVQEDPRGPGGPPHCESPHQSNFKLATLILSPWICPVTSTSRSSSFLDALSASRAMRLPASSKA